MVPVTWVPAFPLASVKSRVNDTAPSASLSCAATVHVQSFPLVLVTVSVFVASVPSNLMAQVGLAAIVSEDVNARVIVFPSMLRSLSLPLFEFRVTDVRVGAVRSAVHE